jgi:diguanylate cyclase (GGDEF)-like protein/putative nucleotidyltransferase with HDIG domain
VNAAARAAGRRLQLSRRGGIAPAPAIFLVVVSATAAVLAVPGHLRPADHTDWLVFCVLTVCAMAAQLFTVQEPGHQSRTTTSVFLVAGALLLPLHLVAVMCLLAHVPEWARMRYPWYIQTFNIANWACATSAAYYVVGALVDRNHLDEQVGRLAAAGAVGAVACAFVNHGLLAQMLRLARGKSYGESGLFTFGSLSTEVILAALGVALAAAWSVAPELVPFVLAPLVVVYRSLQLPSLELAARLDGKTELYNARYFATALASELERAKRFGRPLSIILADLDLLREVNNTYGHLAGDAVLRGVADVLREQMRPFDVAGRFGGEEYSVALPEAGHEDALAIAERIRKAVAETPFRLPGDGGEVYATLSIGVATYPQNETVEDLIHQADLALYRSKALGRNRVSGAATLAVVEPQPLVVAELLVEDERVPHPEPARPPVAHRHVRVIEFVAAIALAAGVLSGFVLAGLPHVVHHHPTAFVAFLVLSVGLQLLGTSIHGRGTDAASTVGIVAAGIALGPAAAVASALAAAGTQVLRRRGKAYRAVFDLADFALSAAASSYLFLALHGDSSVAAGFAAGFVAGVVFKAINVGLLCLAMSIEEGVSPRQVWAERFEWAVLHYVTFGPLAYGAALAYDRMGLLGLGTFAVPPILLGLTMRLYLERTRESVEEVRSVNEALVASNERVHRTYLSTIAALSRAIEAKDDYSGGHIERVRALSVELAEVLGLSGADLEAIEVGALLHDIGKIGVSERILNKPGPLSEKEWAEMREHPVISDYILTGVELHPYVRQIVRSSHERVDGRGYPDGLSGEDVPLPARIVLVADAFDALATDRPYRRGRPVPDALDELRAHVGTQFCPTVIAALESLWAERPQVLTTRTTRLHAVAR